MIKCLNILTKSSPNFNAVFIKDLALKTTSYIWKKTGRNIWVEGLITVLCFGKYLIIHCIFC